MTSVLISGAGVAGPTLAFLLARRGFRVTVVERSAAIRSSGAPVDVEGDALAVVEGMAVLPRLEQARTRATGLVFVDDRGRVAGRVPMQPPGGRDIELPRGDLAQALYEASRDDAEYRFHDGIATLAQDPQGVNVIFESGAEERFDLVVGTDGFHSRVRQLAFGPESAFVRHLGLYVATLPVDGLHEASDIVMFNAPGRSLTIHPSRDRAMAAFIFRSPERTDLVDAAAERRFVAEIYAGDGWKVPEVLAQLRDADDVYFDSVSRVDLDRWSSGRVTLLGDAASCVSLLGGGTSLALLGAETLARALGEHEPTVAFARYEEVHRRRVGPSQRGTDMAAALLIPATRTGIRVRNLATRFWPVAAGVSAVSRWIGGRGAAET